MERPDVTFWENSPVRNRGRAICPILTDKRGTEVLWDEIRGLELAGGVWDCPEYTGCALAVCPGIVVKYKTTT